MNMNEGGIAARCVEFLVAHATRGDEGARHEAYILGREALAAGIGVLSMMTVFHEALGASLTPDPGPSERLRRLDALGSLTLEVLAPFEMAHRGAREANKALRRANEAREEEIKRVAHAIHDEVGQLLACVHWALDDALRTIPAKAREPLRIVGERLDLVEKRLRELSYELRPTILDDLGLEPALRSLADGVSRRTGIPVSVEGACGGRPIPRIETVVYRVAQEALNNAVRHAKAAHVVIRLERLQGTIQCSVRDDGIGFPKREGSGLDVPAGLGLIGIRERVANVGGTMEIWSAEGRGTQLSIRIPLGGSDGSSSLAG
jgi:signal transduction histidine kinase